MGNIFVDIVVIKSGDLVYIDLKNFSVNIVKNIEIFEVVILKEWRFFYVCCFFLGDILVVMDNLNGYDLKVVCYFGLIEK